MFGGTSEKETFLPCLADTGVVRREGAGVGVGVGEVKGCGGGVVGWRSWWESRRAGPLFLLALSASRTVVVVVEVLSWRFPVLYKDKVYSVFYDICVLMFMYYTVGYFTGIFLQS